MSTFRERNVKSSPRAGRRGSGGAGRTGGAGRRSPKPAAPYHHGALRAALLAAAERILERDGIAGLTLRAAAREAGVSHAAPKNHFDDLKGLLSELAATGFERLGAAMRADLRADDAPRAQMAAIGTGYVTFAMASPGLFVLMFRGERLDFSRPALRAAADAAFGVLSATIGSGAPGDAKGMTLPQVARIAAAWSLVHGLAMLLIDGRLKPLMARLPGPADEAGFIAAVLRGAQAAPSRSSSPPSQPALK
jgi:AcrR family transcriptional regulator